jgi:hypothetical protein
MFKNIIYYSAFLLFFSYTTLAKVISPENGAVLKVGETVTMQLEPGSPGETVSAFFFHDRSQTLFGGPLDKGSFDFVVPQGAVNPSGEPSELVIVHRKNRYLQSVDAVDVNVVS